MFDIDLCYLPRYILYIIATEVTLRESFCTDHLKNSWHTFSRKLIPSASRIHSGSAIAQQCKDAHSDYHFSQKAAQFPQFESQAPLPVDMSLVPGPTVQGAELCDSAARYEAVLYYDADILCQCR